MSGDAERAIGFLLAAKAVTAALAENLDLALRALTDAEGEQGEAAICEHDPERDELVSTLNEKPRRRCKACGAEYETEATW